MKNRYVVRPCDNGGDVQPKPPRDRTWDVFDTVKGETVAAGIETRAKARETALVVYDGEFAEWKAAAQAHANDLELPPDLWTEADDYDLAEPAAAAFARGDDPKAFVEEMFEEDLARKQGEEDEQRQAMEHAMEECE